MFNLGVVRFYKYNNDWYVAFRCPCKQCKDSVEESTVWKYPWKPVIKDYE